MHEYDTVLKALLQGPADTLFEQISGTRIETWLPVELPLVENRRMDLLGRTFAGLLIHFELQSTNDPLMALRMAEYFLRIYRIHKVFVRQIVLYVGDAPLRMERTWKSPTLEFSYEIFDIRELDGDRLLESPGLSDNIIGILARLKDRREAIRRVLQRIADLTGVQRETALRQLSILAGLRRMETEIEEERRTMPILDDIMNHAIIGPAIRQGEEKGLKKGREVGRQEGRLEATRELVRLQIEQSFGPLDGSTERRFLSLTTPQLNAVALRLRDAKSLDELFR